MFTGGLSTCDNVAKLFCSCVALKTLCCCDLLWLVSQFIDLASFTCCYFGKDVYFVLHK